MSSSHELWSEFDRTNRPVRHRPDLRLAAAPEPRSRSHRWQVAAEVMATVLVLALVVVAGVLVHKLHHAIPLSERFQH